MKSLAGAFATLLLLAASAFGADVAGKWKSTWEAPNGNTIESTFDFKVDGTTLTGTISGRMGEAKISDGKVDGDTISFSIVREIQGEQRKINYKGKLKGDQIDFNIEFGERSFDIVAKRVTS